MLKISIQAKAANLSQTAQLLMQMSAQAIAGGTITQVIVVPTMGVNSKGEVVETTQLTGIFQAQSDNESLKLSVSELTGKKIFGLSGVIELVKARVQIIGATPGSDLINTTNVEPKLSPAAVKAAAAKAAAAKAAAAKAAAAKAAAAKAAAAKAAAAKAAAAKAAAAKAAAAKKPTPKKP
jgi:hypothetical protein